MKDLKENAIKLYENANYSIMEYAIKLYGYADLSYMSKRNYAKNICILV